MSKYSYNTVTNLEEILKIIAYRKLPRMQNPYRVELVDDLSLPFIEEKNAFFGRESFYRGTLPEDTSKIQFLKFSIALS